MLLVPEITGLVQEEWRERWSKSSAKPSRVFYVARCYRYERPQAGRYREFTQIGVELLGGRAPADREEVERLLVSLLDELGVGYVLDRAVSAASRTTSRTASRRAASGSARRSSSRAAVATRKASAGPSASTDSCWRSSMDCSPRKVRARRTTRATPTRTTGRAARAMRTSGTRRLAFDEVYGAHVAFVWRVVRTLGVGDAHVEDAVQDVFVVVHRQLHEFEGVPRSRHGCSRSRGGSRPAIDGATMVNAACRLCLETNVSNGACTRGYAWSHRWAGANPAQRAQRRGRPRM